ncbi:MAG: glucokinase [Desulfocapsaceae bacterium]|nr:glucokinase [Desulfocapsaceae bacterium]
MSYLLTIDLGGTNSRFGFTDLADTTAIFKTEAVYENVQFASIEEVIESFFAEHELKADYLCIAVAGVVEDGVVELTNLSWRADAAQLRDRFGFKRVWILNDMAALAEAIPSLHPDDLVELCSGVARKEETIGVIAPGTGLGQGYLIFHEGQYIARGSEGGHSTFAPTNIDELDLASWLLQHNLDMSIEQICSGPGLTQLYNYYIARGDVIPAEWVRQEVNLADNLAPIIVRGATSADPCPLCVQVINRFLSLLGSESSNLALKIYARGGIYIGGGVLLHLLGKVSFQPFVKAFRAKGKMTDLLQHIPVYIITKKHVNLHGAVVYAKKIVG